MASYPKFVQDLKELDLKKKGRKPKVSPQKFYPSQIELQTNELLKEELDDYARKLKSAAEKGGVKGVYSVLGAPPDSFEKKTKAIAEDVNKFQIKAFADFSSLVIGERYFPSTDQKNLIIKTWTDNFVNLCKSTNEEMRKRSAGIISDGVLNGRNMKELVKELQSSCSDFSRNKAELIAATEIGKLNTAINRAQSESIGLKYYEWSAAMDGRTRESHSLMDGKICAWGKDDVYYEWVEGKDGKRELKEFKRTDKMYHGAPGTDFRCRCVALPYDPEFEDDYVREEGPVRGVVQAAGESAIELPLINNRNVIQETLIKSFKVAKEKHPDAKYKRMDVDGSVWVDEKRLDKVFENIPKKRTPGDEVDKFNKEYEMAQILKRYGYGTILVEEKGPSGVPTPDAIVDGEVSAFKQIDGKIGRIEDNLKKALDQDATTICLNIKRDFSKNAVVEIIRNRIKGKNGITVYFYLTGMLYKISTKKTES